MFAKFWLVLFVVAGVLLERRQPELARRLARICPLILLTVLVCLLVTGAHRVGEPSGESHRWLGRAMVIIGWIGAWFSVGVLAARERLVWAIAKCTLVFATLALVVLASFTGYLVPWDPAEARFVGEATLNRFYILHMVALPVALVLLSVGWWRAFRSPSAAHHLGEFRVEATAEVGAGSIGAHHARDAVNRTNGSSRGS